MATHFSPDKMREARTRCGLTKTALHEVTGVSLVSISRIEMGWTLPAVTTLMRLADTLGVGVGEFFDTTPDGDR